MNEVSRPDSSPDEFDLHKARVEYDAYVQHAREHHARTGEWPPDPLLDEVDEMRRQIMAEHGNDWRKVLKWHLEQDRLFVQQNPNAKFAEKRGASAGVSGQ
jgi:hypothetical protein